MGTDIRARKIATWLGWALVLLAWSDLGLSWLLGADRWKQFSGGVLGDLTSPSFAVVAGCVGVVLLSYGRRDTKTLPPPGGGSASDD